MVSRVEQAVATFEEGYNCAQAIFVASAAKIIEEILIEDII